MHCPDCEHELDWDWIDDEGIDANEVFSCPHCNQALRYVIDEGTYLGAIHKSLEAVDD